MPRDSHRLVPSLASVGFAVFALAASAHAQIHVDPAGSDLGAGTFGDPFLTINHAAMVASAGSTIFVHAGTYGDEQGIVQLGTKDLVLQGDGAAITTLQPHATATIALAPADPNVATPLAHRVGILFAGAARVHLRDLTIDAQGFAPASGQLAGLYLRGGVDVVCDHVAVRDCRPTALGGGRANAVVVRGDAPTDPSTLSARDGSFTG
ncbi:MAG: hypothetical protein KDE27_31045, partial [Planctomycetes bacterium]|nr:hypothetical protein [Planctomycetota bacterium]